MIFYVDYGIFAHRKNIPNTSSHRAFTRTIYQIVFEMESIRKIFNFLCLYSLIKKMSSFHLFTVDWRMTSVRNVSGISKIYFEFYYIISD